MTESPLACPRCHQVFLPSQAAPPPAPLPTYPPPHRPPAAPRPRLSAPSVPKLLLGLGATALLVAAALFLAVAWAGLGTAGRTTVLLALTAAAGAAGQWATARGLRVAGESLTAVAFGLGVLDVLGAASAGWLGVDPGGQVVAAALGGVLLVAGLAGTLPRRRLAVPQLAAPLGLALLTVGALADTGPRATTAIVALGALAVAGLGQLVGAQVLRWTSIAYAGGAVGVLGLAALVGALDEPSLEHLWRGDGWWLLAVVALVQLARTALPRHRELTWAVHAVSGAVLTLVATLPVVDEGATAITLTAAGATLVWAVVARLLPSDALVVPLLSLLGTVPALLAAPLVLAAQAVFALTGARTAVVVEPWLLPLGAVVLAAALAIGLPRLTRLVPVVVVVTAGYLTAPLYDLPLWLSVAVPLAAAAVLVLSAREMWAAPLLLLALGIGVPDAALTTAVLAVTALAAVAALRRRPVEAGAVLPLALTGLLWSVGVLAGVEPAQRSLAAVAVVGLLAIVRPRLEVEALGWAAGLVASGVALAGGTATQVAVHLTLAGALVTASALVHRERRAAAWVGGALLALATWVRLADLGVHAPEAYTLPTALALLLVGLDRLRREPGADTVPTLLPGLALALVPSLLWALVDPLSARALAVGAGCLALLLAGALLRWSAPVLVGAVAGGLLLLRELAPYAAATPQWLAIGAAGTVLVVVGTTWEARLRDLRQVAGYVEHLR